MKKFINRIKIDYLKRKAPVVLIVALLILVVVLLNENSNLKYEISYVKTIPDVELINYISFDSKNIASGSITGFVLFENKEKQPSGLRQYVEITASQYSDKDGKQLFYERDIIKMSALPPRYFDTVVLTMKDLSGNTVTLADADGNLFFIDKNTKEVSMLDATGDMSKLITDESDFRDFIRKSFKR